MDIEMNAIIEISTVHKLIELYMVILAVKIIIIIYK